MSSSQRNRSRSTPRNRSLNRQLRETASGSDTEGTLSDAGNAAGNGTGESSRIVATANTNVTTIYSSSITKYNCNVNSSTCTYRSNCRY